MSTFVLAASHTHSIVKLTVVLQSASIVFCSFFVRQGRFCCAVQILFFFFSFSFQITSTQGWVFLSQFLVFPLGAAAPHPSDWAWFSFCPAVLQPRWREELKRRLHHRRQQKGFMRRVAQMKSHNYPDKVDILIFPHQTMSALIKEQDNIESHFPVGCWSTRC